MQIKIKCPNKDCGKTLIVDAEMGGKKGKCSTCDSIFLIPEVPGTSAPSGQMDVPPSAAETAEQRKPPSKSRSRKSPKRPSGSKSGEKFLDDYVAGAGGKKPSKASREELDDYSVPAEDYVDYVEYEEEKPRRRPRQERAPGSARDDFYDDVQDYEDYDAPRRRRRRDDDYEEDVYEEDYYEPPYEEPYGATVRSARSGSRRSRGPNIGLIRAGLMILAVAGCVFCAALGIKVLVELIAILSSDIGKTSGTIWKIAETIWFVSAVAVIVGYSFLMFFPNRNGSLGLTIAALTVGAINLIVQMVFKIIPMYSDGSGFLGLDFGFGFGGSKIEPFLKIGFMESLFIAEMILLALAMMAINRQLKDRHNLQQAKHMIIPAGIYGGILLVMGMFALIVSETGITSQTAATIWKWVFYMLRVGSQGMLIWYFISYILLMFNTRTVMRRA